MEYFTGGVWRNKFRKWNMSLSCNFDRWFCVVLWGALVGALGVLSFPYYSECLWLRLSLSHSVSSLQTLEQRNAERRRECCGRNTRTLNQKWILKSELPSTITNAEAKPKSDWVDNMFSSLQKETSLRKATDALTLSSKLLLDTLLLIR